MMQVSDITTLIIGLLIIAMFVGILSLLTYVQSLLQQIKESKIAINGLLEAALFKDVSRHVIEDFPYKYELENKGNSDMEANE